MKNVEVLLRDHVDALGECGDVVRVKPGFARNFLIPRRLAVEATADNKKQMERRRVKLQAEAVVRTAEQDARIAALNAVSLVTLERADEQGHLFGSVQAGTLAQLLLKAGHTVEEKHIRLDAPIKTLGLHRVRIHVHGERFAEISVDVQRPDAG
jgi:large subunit ribosomal protein L9